MYSQVINSFFIKKNKRINKDNKYTKELKSFKKSFKDSLYYISVHTVEKFFGLILTCY